MFTSWEQVKSWIEDNNFPHWIFYKNNPDGRDEKANDKIIDSNNFVVSDMSDKLDMTEKYLRMYGGKVYGVGFKSPNSTVGGLVCEARIDADQPQSASGISGGYPSIGELTETITKQVRAEIEAANMKQREKELERREKEFEAKEQSAIGAIVHYLAPVGQLLLQKKMMPNVAGLDAEEQVEAEPVKPIVPKEQVEEQELVDMANDFSDEEEEKLYDLMKRFKAVEPQYLELIEAVVKMAEAGDSTYTMAKGVLLK